MSERLFFDPVELNDLDIDTVFHQYEEPCELKQGMIRRVICYENKADESFCTVGVGRKDDELRNFLWFGVKLGDANEDISDFSTFLRSAGEICQEQHKERLSAHFVAGKEGFI